MPSACLYFQVHQPQRLKPYNCFSIGEDHSYHDDLANKTVLDRVSDKCYLPTNQTILELIRKTDGRFRVAFAISGTALEQFEKFRPDVLGSFQELGSTGCVEFIGETYYHSLSFIYSRDEFVRQVEKHSRKIRTLFGQVPRIFRNTELIYNNALAAFVDGMGFKGVLCEGLDHILLGRSPNF